MRDYGRTLLGSLCFSQGGMRETRETYDAVADEYASRHVDRTGIMDQFDRFCDRLDDGPVLDVGCGPGWETAELARRGYRTLGIDVSRELLRHAYTHLEDVLSASSFLDASLAAMDMRSLGLPADAFGGIWACASVHHVSRDATPRVLDEFARILRQGGMLAVSVKRGEGTTTGDAYPEDERHFTCYQPDELESVLRTAGFETEHVDASEEWVWTWAKLVN